MKCRCTGMPESTGAATRSILRLEPSSGRAMAQPAYHPSIEGAQHGAKSLAQFLDYAKGSGAAGAQPSNYMLQASDGGFKKREGDQGHVRGARRLRSTASRRHCPFWVHTTAWTGSPTIRPFIPADVAKKSPAQIEKWAEKYLLQLLDLAAELKIRAPDVLGRGLRLGSGHRLSVGLLGRAATTTCSRKARSASSRRPPRLRKAANERGIYPLPRNPSRHRRDVRRRLQHARGDLRRRQVPRP